MIRYRLNYLLDATTCFGRRQSLFYHVTSSSSSISISTSSNNRARFNHQRDPQYQLFSPIITDSSYGSFSLTIISGSYLTPKNRKNSHHRSDLRSSSKIFRNLFHPRISNCDLSTFLSRRLTQLSMWLRIPALSLAQMTWLHYQLSILSTFDMIIPSTFRLIFITTEPFCD